MTLTPAPLARRSSAAFAALTPLVVLFAAGPGCVVYEYAGAGVVTSTSGNPGRTGGAFDFVGAVGRVGGGDSPVAITMGSHFMISQRTAEFAPSLGLEVSPPPLAQRFVPFAGLSVRPLSFGLADGSNPNFGGQDFSFSVLSPQLSAGMMFLIDRQEDQALHVHLVAGWTIVLRGVAYYDVRLTSQPNELYLGATIGPGIYFAAF